MNCSNCDCLDLGCFFHNEDKSLGIIAAIEGVHQLRFRTSFSNFKVDVFFELGELMSLPADIDFNENMQYYLTIIDPAGDEITVDEKSCFRFQIVENNTLCNDTVYYE
jgi:hypothetical protein